MIELPPPEWDQEYISREALREMSGNMSRDGLELLHGMVNDLAHECATGELREAIDANAASLAGDTADPYRSPAVRAVGEALARQFDNFLAPYALAVRVAQWQAQRLPGTTLPEKRT